MNKQAYRGVWAIVFCGFAAAGCKETVEGKYLDTEGIALVADVTADSETQSKMELSFLSGGDESNTYVDLADDKVTVSGDGKAKVLNPTSRGEYSTTFASGKSDAEFTIALDRKDADKKDAKGTSGKLPKSFAVTVEGTGDHSRQGELKITWAPHGDADSVDIDIDGDCVFLFSKTGESDDGAFTVPAKELIFGGDNDKEADCDATVTVTRTRKGTVDSVFDSESKLRLHQVRSAKFNSVK